MSLFDRSRMLYPWDNKHSWEDPVTFEEKMGSLVEGLTYVSSTVGQEDCPTGDLEIALALIKQIPTLYDVIAHGGPEHREWLKQAIEQHFQGLPMPEYKG
jgi:hypothetical protein